MPYRPIPEKTKDAIRRAAAGQALSHDEAKDLAKKHGVSLDTVRRLTRNPAAASSSDASPSSEAPAASIEPLPEPEVEVDEQQPEALPSFEGMAEPVVAAPGAPPVASMPIKPLVEILCSIFDGQVAGRVGAPSGPPQPPAPISAEERQALAEALQPLSDKYLASASPYMPEITALLVVGGVFGTRLLQARAYAAYVKAQQQEHAAAQAPPPYPEPQVEPISRPAPSRGDERDLGEDLLRRMSG